MVDLKIQVTVKDLLKHLERNKAAHVKEYSSALKVYFKKLKSELAKMTESVAASKMRSDDYIIRFARPVNKSKEYDKYIRMLKMSVDTQVEISATEYDCFVNDEWEWIQYAKTTNTFYNSSRSR